MRGLARGLVVALAATVTMTFGIHQSSSAVKPVAKAVTTLPPHVHASVPVTVPPHVVQHAVAPVSHAVSPVPLVSPALMAKWAKVNICEEGGRWHIRGSLYSGGLGITNHNWQYFSRGTGFPANAADATPEQQVFVAIRIEHWGGAGDYVPDQYGCGHGW